VRAPLAELALEPGLDRVEASAAPPPGEGPLVAICMATYDPPAELLRRQLESIREQTHGRWICLISDDLSPAPAFELLRSLVEGDPRFAVSRSTERLGAYRNFERALAMVPTEATHIALADQDDRWHPDKVASLLRALGDATLAYADMRIVSESGLTLSDSFWADRRNNYTSLRSLLLANTVTGAASLFRRELLDTALPFPPETPDAFHDQWLASAALATGSIAYVDRPLHDYVQHGSAQLGHAAATRGYDPRRTIAGGHPRRTLAAIAEHARRSYFLNAVRIAVSAGTLEQRVGPRLRGERRDAVRRLARLGSRHEPAAWLAARSLRPLFGRSETAGIELSLLAAVAWRRGVTARARR
jgi:glycosyl transferase family 2